MSTVAIEDVVQQSPRTAARVVEGRAVVIVIDAQALHTLNPVGTFIWTRAQDGVRLADVVDAVVGEFEVSQDRAREDVLAFARELVELGALELKGAS